MTRHVKVQPRRVKVSVSFDVSRDVTRDEICKALERLLDTGTKGPIEGWYNLYVRCERDVPNVTAVRLSLSYGGPTTPSSAPSAVIGGMRRGKSRCWIGRDG